MKYIDADKLIALIDAKLEDLGMSGSVWVGRSILQELKNDITSLQQEQHIIEEDWVEKRKQECGCRKLSSNGNYQCERYEGAFGPCDGRCSWIVDYPKLKELEAQEQPETDMKSPFTGGKVTILSIEEEVTFRGEKIKVTRKYYRCVDTGREFTDSKVDEDMMWAVFRAYCEKKGMTSFTDIMLKQEQPDKYETALEKAREWMPNVNQGGHAILISIFPELGEGLDPRYGGRKQEQQGVDLDALVELVDEAFDEYGSVDGYGQLSVSFNRSELYSFIKKIAR